MNMDFENAIVTTEGKKYKTVVTDIGNAKMVLAALHGEKVNVVAAVAGDGGGSYYIPTADMTAIKNEVWRGPIAGMEVNHTSPNMLDVKVVLPGKAGGFTVRECGVVDDDGDLIAVCNLPDTEKVVVEDGVAGTLTILMHIVLTDGDNLNFTVDPTIDTASAVNVAFTIERDAWQSAGMDEEEGAGDYPYRADAVCDAATALHIPVVTLDKGSLGAARACELCPTAETLAGALRFWSKKVPDGDIRGTVLLVTQGGGSSGGEGGGSGYTLPTATEFRLGGVKIGDGVKVQEDGTVSVDGESFVEEVAAPDGDVKEMLDTVFGGETAEGN